MNKTFNTVRYIELLKKDQNLESKNSSLYQENEVEFFELLSYGKILNNQIVYDRRHDYISLIEKYLTDEIGSFSFKIEFFKIRSENMKIQEELKKEFGRLSNVLIDSKSAEFAALIRDIRDGCEFLELDSEPEEAYGLTELECRAFLEKIFLKMKKYSDK